MPRIKVQVKHRQNTASVKEVRELIGVLSKDGDSGLFVSTVLTSVGKKHRNTLPCHIEMIAAVVVASFGVWIGFYDPVLVGGMPLQVFVKITD